MRSYASLRKEGSRNCLLWRRCPHHAAAAQASTVGAEGLLTRERLRTLHCLHRRAAQDRGRTDDQDKSDGVPLASSICSRDASASSRVISSHISGRLASSRRTTK